MQPKQALLSFDQSPPLSAPLRFFLTAPLFLVLAGLLVAVEGEALFASRWTPAALAATHLLTIGFMLQVMLGALIQILPVLAGANLARPALIAAIVHPGLSLGTLALAGGFLAGSTAWLYGAGLLLAISLLVFIAAAGWAIFRVPSTSPSIRGLKLSLLALAIAGGSGLFMLLALAGGWAVPLPALANLHAGWGLAGWSGILLAAVAYVVVPMFQLTPGYPARPAWWFPVAVVLALVLWSISVLLDADGLARGAQGLLALSGVAFVLQTLKLQSGRRRARADCTFRYWQGGLYASLAALLMLLLDAFLPALSTAPAWPLLFGVLILVGGFLAFIIGMLYKIIPFLLWFNLQHQAAVPGKPVPSMNKLLDDGEMQRQMRTFFAAFALLTAAVFQPDRLALPAGMIFALAGGWLGWNLLQAALRHRRHRLAGTS